MSDFDIFPTLDEPETAAPQSSVATTKAADLAIEDIDLQKIALAHFDVSNVALQTARQKLTGVVHDLSTATKLAEAKSLRERLINAPLAEARKVNKGLKAKLTAVSKAVGARLESIEAGFAEAEKLITPQIEARDADLAAEKAEREAKEAARVAVHRENIAKLASYVGQAQGKTSAQILTIINGVSGIDTIPEQWEEFAVGAEMQKEQTLEALQALFSSTKTAEDEAAAREAQRIENERVAAELAEKERALAEKQAEIDRKLAVIAAAEKAEADRVEAAAQAQRDAEAKAAREAASAELGRQQAEAQAAKDADLKRIIEANRLAQKAAAGALQVAADATPAEVIADAYEATPAADMDDIATKPWTLPAAEEPVAYTGRMAVSTGVLHPTPGPVTFAEPEPSAADALSALLAHIDEAFAGRFPAHPKPSPEWWGTLRRLTDEARETVAT
jgi:hypothetical protein